MKYILLFVTLLALNINLAHAQTGEQSVQADVLNFIINELSNAAYTRNLDGEQLRRRGIVAATAATRQEYMRRKISREQREFEERRDRILTEQIREDEYRRYRTRQEFERQRRESEHRARYCRELAAKNLSCQ